MVSKIVPRRSFWIQVLLNKIDITDQLRQSFKCVVFTLNWNKYFVRGNKRVNGEKLQ